MLTYEQALAETADQRILILAMLAALKAMKLRTQCSSYGMGNDIAEMIRAAIAAAKAAGIKAED